MHDPGFSSANLNSLPNRLSVLDYLGRKAGLPGSLRDASHGRDWLSRRRDSVDLSNRNSNVAKPDSAQTSRTETSSYTRRTSLDLKLNLQFDFSFISAVAKKVESGELGATEAIEHIVRGSFGIHADFSAEGTDEITVSETSVESRGSSRSHIAHLANALRKYGQNSKTIFGNSGAFNDGSNGRVRQRFVQTVRSFQLRYTRDASFDFQKFTRFLNQAERIDAGHPDKMTGYLDSTRSLVDNSTESSLAVFFDAVESYLEGFESDLKANVDTFFDQIEQMSGFSPDVIDTARDSFTGAIDSFFDRVSQVMDSLSGNVSESEQVSSARQPSSSPDLKALDIIA